MTINFHTFVENFIAAVEAKDSYTAGHSDRVADITMMISEAMEMTHDQRYIMHIAGHLHDIGKIGIPDGILLKTGRLTPEEFGVMKAHSKIGYNILKNNDNLQDVAEIILFHHERFDGTGYPTGRKGKDIPLGARIIAVADSFDAMVTRRTYKEKMTLEMAIEEIKSQSGKQFDPDVAQAFLKLLDQEESKKTIMGYID